MKEKMLAKVNQVRKNNRGFTLVELIIVVAIIAVLAAVLAPQYIRYVERSRESNDIQVATHIMRGTTAAVTDPQNKVPSGVQYTVTWTSGTSLSVQSTGLTGSRAPASGTGTLTAADKAAGKQILSSVLEVMGWTGTPAESSSGSGTWSATLDTTQKVQAESAGGLSAPFTFTFDSETGGIDVTSANWVTIGVAP